MQNPWEEAFFRFFVSSRHVPAHSARAIDQLDSRARGQWRMATVHVGVGLCFTSRGHKLRKRYSILAPRISINRLNSKVNSSVRV